MKDILSIVMKRLGIVLFALLLLAFVATGNQRTTIVSYNANMVKSVEAIHIVNKYNNLVAKIEPVFAETMQDVALYGPTKPVSFVGTITGYGPDCEGCGGKVGCPPRQDVRNGNIYFEDQEYGTVRIVATDRAIPCGSMIRISNFKFSDEPIIAIALDRGGAIVGKTMDLLYESEADTVVIGRQHNIQYEIIRWGW